MTDPQQHATPGKRLCLFFDGTWNEAGDHTNVWRLYLMLDDRGIDGIPQQAYYDAGVGTHWYDRATGGAFGAGLSGNIRHAYRWLMEHYDPGDEIYVFGFSRGAFTARSLAGLMARCGLLKPDAPLSFVQLYERYRRGDLAIPLHKMLYFRAKPETFEDQMLLKHTYYQRNLIKMVGVWDTVGSLGVPLLSGIRGVSRDTFDFHNTRLSTIVEHSYQALALDEYRKPYWAVLWTDFVPKGAEGKPKGDDNRTIEQRWFAGAHANVGGGYQSDLLGQRPLAWMQAKAVGCGLGFRSTLHPTDEDLDMPPRDSYSEFLKGAWKGITFGKRYVRWLQSDPVFKPSRPRRSGGQSTAGWVRTVNERIDESVFRRCQLRREYCPLSMQEWATRKKLDLQALLADSAAQSQYTAAISGPGIENQVAP